MAAGAAGAKGAAGAAGALGAIVAASAIDDPDQVIIRWYSSFDMDSPPMAFVNGNMEKPNRDTARILALLESFISKPPQLINEYLKDY